MKRTFFVALAALLLTAMPAAAGSLLLYPSYWSTEDADEVAGAGLRAEFPFNDWVGFEIGAQYYEELTSEPIQLAGDSPGLFEDDSISVLPAELGFRFDVGEPQGWEPYVAAGGSYFVLDSDFGDLDDEFGYFAGLGSSFGNGRGPDFFAEVQHRWVDGTIESLDLDDNPETNDQVHLDLQGFVVNAGVKFNFGVR